MDVILGIFFQNFEQSERNHLHSRHNRRTMVEYFNTLIEGCRLGQECEPEKVVKEAIISILRYHENSRNQNGGVCLMGKYHNILYVGLKLCYDWQLKDSATVGSLLDNIFMCEKTFERLFVGALFGTRAPHFIAGWKSDFENQEENVRALVYYLDHAQNACLDYDYNDYKLRFIDVPIECCGKATALKIVVQLNLPDKLHILLRFGALVNPDFDQSESVVEILLNKLSEFKGKYPYNIVSCMQLILRAVSSLPIKPQAGCEEGSNYHRDYIMEQYPYLVEHAILPLNRCGFVPPNLKHLCRCAVRRIMWKNYQLPTGIHSLPIPCGLRRYIDLMED